jgi:hypothetical protein
VHLITHVHLLSTLRMRGAIPPSPLHAFLTGTGPTLFLTVVKKYGIQGVAFYEELDTRLSLRRLSSTTRGCQIEFVVQNGEVTLLEYLNFI